MKKILLCVRFKNECNHEFLENNLLTELSDIGCELLDKINKAYNNGVFYCFNYLDVYILFDEFTGFQLDYTTLYRTYSDVRMYEYDEANFENFKDVINNVKGDIIDNKNIEAATKTLFINLPDMLMHSENVEEYVEVITKIAELKFGCPLRSIYTKPKDGPYKNKNNNDIWKLSKYVEEMSSADYYAGVDLFQKTKIYNWIDDTASDFDIPKLVIPYYIFEKYE